MLSKLLPPAFDNEYRGRPLGLYLFFAITLLTLTRSLIHMFLPDGGAESIATIPLNTYTVNSQESLILIFAFMGLSQLVISLLYILTFLRYRSMIPLFYLLMFFEYVMRIILESLKPIYTVGTAPGVIGDYVMVPLTLIGLWVATSPKKRLS